MLTTYWVSIPRKSTFFSYLLNKYIFLLLGLFNKNHIEYVLDRNNSGVDPQPTLPEMLKKAIDILKKESRGYFLFVEAGRIDHAHHRNKAARALSETVEFDEAIALAMNEAL